MKRGGKKKEMHKTLKMRVMSLLLAVVMVVSCMPTSAFAAYTEVAPGYNTTTKVLSLHNSETTGIKRETILGWFNYESTDSFCIKRGSDEIWDSTAGILETLSLEAGETYTVETKTWKQTGKPWQVWIGEWVYTLTATFTVKVYDKLTITTTKDGETTPETVNLYRGDSYDINK